MIRLDQIVVGASPRDAVTNAALELQSLLQKVGPSDIFAYHLTPGLRDSVYPLGEFDRRHRRRSVDDVLVVHVSIGEPDLARWVLDRPERLVVVYHNLSPAEVFRPYDPVFAELLDQGRRELVHYRDKATLAMADSAYSAAELTALGYRDVRVSPLILRLRELTELPPSSEAERLLAEQVHGPVALFVGQLLPHKRPDFLAQAFHILVTYLVPEATMLVVGTGRLAAYERALRAYVKDLGLDQFRLCGSVDGPSLATYYRHADVFVTASEHEGFCAPLCESMAFGLPIVARRFAAIPETLGDGGLLLDPDDSPAVLAEALAAAIEEPALQADLEAASRARLAAFDPDDAAATFLEHLLSVV